MEGLCLQGDGNPEGGSLMDRVNYLFGKVERAKKLTIEELEEIIAVARKKSARLRQVPVKKIMKLLVKTGRAILEEKGEIIPELEKELQISRAMIELCFTYLQEILSYEGMAERVRNEIGSVDVLDTFVTKPGYEGMLHAAPVGVVFFVPAGNIFLSTIDTFAALLLTKNVPIVRLSSDNVYLPLLFARKMRELDEEGVISSAFCMLNIEREEIENLDLLKSRCDAVLAYGGDEAMRFYARDLPYTTRFLGFGPKIGIALVAAEDWTKEKLPEIAGLVARDVAIFDQASCASPQNLFVPDGEPEKVQMLIEAIAKEMEAIEQSLPRSEATDDDYVESLRTFELYRVGEILKGKGRFARSRAGKWHVVFDETMEITPSPLGRFLIVKPYRDFGAFLEMLGRYREVLQTCSVYANDRVRQRYALELLKAGMTKVVPMGMALTSTNGSPHDGVFQLAQLLRWGSADGLDRRAALKENVRTSLLDYDEEIARIRKEELLGFAKASTKFYSGLKDENFYLTGEDVRLNLPPNGDGLLSRKATGYLFSSGGTTGAPKYGFYSNEEFHYSAKLLAYGLAHAGLEPDDRVLNLFIPGKLWSGFLAVNEALLQINCTVLPLGGEVEEQKAIELIEKFKVTALMGMPANITRIFQVAGETGMVEKLKSLEKIFYAGEPFPKVDEAMICQVLPDVKIRSAGYACVDTGPIAFPCPVRGEGVHHCLPDVFVEIEEGEIIVTPLYRRTTPIIRYRTGDRGEWLEGTCECGYTGKTFKLGGRVDEMVMARNIRFHASEVEDVLRRVLNAEEVQFQVAVCGKTISLKVRGTGDAEGLRRAIIAKIEELRMGLEKGWIEFTVEISENPGFVKTRLGKVKRVVNG
ncbi:MAG: AMP-binding protein [Thermoplasmata archaeon]|nr:AMP-binding protein [Thermoplasmata archaeon]